MTAFGRSTLKTSAGEIVCELRSVNHRYLDISIRLPEPVRAAEQGLRDRLSSSLHRGKIEAVVKLDETATTANSVTVNEALLVELAQTAGKVCTLTNAQCVVDSVKLLQWPGVIRSRDEGQDTLVRDTHASCDSALKDLLATRRREGDQISELLSDRNQQLAKLLEQLRKRRPDVVKRQRTRLLSKLSSLATDYDEARLEQELVYAAQRLDIDEEMDRLDAHIRELKLVLQRDEPVGRRLDFLMQEFNREANTLSAKSAESETTALAVDMKVLIEQMREQVQNVE